MSSMIHSNTNPAMPIEVAEIMLDASGRLYDGSFAFMLPVSKAEANYKRRRNRGITEQLYWIRAQR